MPEIPPLSPTAPARRRKRRWLRRLLWGLGLTLLLLWIVKVPLLNWGLRRVPGDYDITVTSVRPGFSGATLSGVRVVHRPTGRQVGYAREVEVEGGWTGMVNGELKKLVVSGAEAMWRPEFEMVMKFPLVPGPPASPFLTWQHGEVRDSVFSWYERGKEIPRLTMKIVRYDGGPMSIYNDGTIEASEQSVVLDDVVSREFVLDETLEIETRSPRAEAVATAQHKENRYTVESLKATAPQLNIVWRRGQPPPPAEPGPPEPPYPDWYRRAVFLIREGLSDPARVMFTVHSPNAAPVEFSGALTRLQVAGLRAGRGLPFIIPAAGGRFEGIKSPGSTLEARELIFAGHWDEQDRVHLTSASVNGAAITDSNLLLATFGFSPEETKALPLCRTGFDANCVNLVIGSEGITSADPQEIVLKDFSALLPGAKEPLAKAERVDLSAVPDEAINDKRVRSVTVQKPDVKIHDSPMFAELHPFSAPRPPVSADTKYPGEKPSWFGWRTDTLTVHDGQFKATDLGTGIPNASGTFAVQTVPGDPGGDAFYRVRVDNLSFENPILPAIPLKTDGVMDFDVHPLRVWDEQIDEVRVNGRKVELNEAFIKLFEGGDEKKEPAPSPAVDPPPGKPTTSL